jgi:hypothetical protein
MYITPLRRRGQLDEPIVELPIEGALLRSRMSTHIGYASANIGSPEVLLGKRGDETLTSTFPSNSNRF